MLLSIQGPGLPGDSSDGSPKTVLILPSRRRVPVAGSPGSLLRRPGDCTGAEVAATSRPSPSASSEHPQSSFALPGSVHASA
jgi:hypothetical protein